MVPVNTSIFKYCASFANSLLDSRLLKVHLNMLDHSPMKSSLTCHNFTEGGEYMEQELVIDEENVENQQMGDLGKTLHSPIIYCSKCMYLITSFCLVYPLLNTS